MNPQLEQAQIKHKQPQQIVTPPLRNSQQPQLKTHHNDHQRDLDGFGQIRDETAVSYPGDQHQNSHKIENPKKS